MGSSFVVYGRVMWLVHIPMTYYWLHNHKVIRLGLQIGVKLHVLTSNHRNLTFSPLLREKERELVKRIEEGEKLQKMSEVCVEATDQINYDWKGKIEELQ